DRCGEEPLDRFEIPCEHQAFMRLAELLSSLDDETVDRLSHHHLGVNEIGTRMTICANLENALRSPKHVRDAIYNLQPPSFLILEWLLDADEHTVPLT